MSDLASIAALVVHFLEFDAGHRLQELPRGHTGPCRPPSGLYPLVDRDGGGWWRAEEKRQEKPHCFDYPSELPQVFRVRSLATSLGYQTRLVSDDVPLKRRIHLKELEAELRTKWMHVIHEHMHHRKEP